MDLLGVAGRRPGLPMVVCCSSRDELDAVCSAVANVPYISLASLYTDLAEADRSLILEHFRQATMRWNPEVSAQPAVDSESVKDEQKSHMIVATDACLPLLASGESPIAARVLINYELPTKKVRFSFFLWELDLDVPQFHASIYADSYCCCAMFKETYTRRMTTFLAGDGIVINMVVGGEVVTLKNLEESSNLVIAEMPIHVSLSMLTFPTFCLATLFLSVSLAWMGTRLIHVLCWQTC
ncbi:hypothetical protein C1H46_022822 [Malus baccata]|uniref:Helicase C-terminal domain-containing protein n=1 Tax=Malus baccata TaxID=106549 RepID=A0A540LZA6_MALBA|nr:hypothetical protein C1H46_022822 [Malus baccata]